MVLFIEMLEFGENCIEKDTVMEFISASLLRNISSDKVKSGDVINEMFGDEPSVKKTQFVELIDLKENKEFKNMMGAFLQQNVA